VCPTLRETCDRFPLAACALVLSALACSRPSAPAGDEEGKKDVLAAAPVDATSDGPAAAGEAGWKGADATPVSQPGAGPTPEALPPDRATPDAQEARPDRLPPAGPANPEQAPLFECVRQSAAALRSEKTAGELLLALAAIQARTDPAGAVATLDSLPVEQLEDEPASQLVLALSASAPELALRVTKGMPAGPVRNLCLARLAMQTVTCGEAVRPGLDAALCPDRPARPAATGDVLRALEISARIDPRVSREFQLLRLLEAYLPGGGQDSALIMDRVIEPILNDFAMVRAAAKEAETNPAAAAAALRSIESDVVRKWGLMAVALQALLKDDKSTPELMSQVQGYQRDELLRQAADLLAGSAPDRAVSLALRIQAPHRKEQAMAAVAEAIFPARPGMAARMLRDVHDDVAFEEALSALVVQTCKTHPDRAEAVLAVAADQLAEDSLGRGLSACCPTSPKTVRDLLDKKGLPVTDAYRRCQVCAGLVQEPRPWIERIKGQPERERSLACLSLSLLPTSVDEAVATAGRISDRLAKDEALASLARELAAGGRNEESDRVAAMVADRYLSLALRIERFPEAEADRAAWLQGLEDGLAGLQDPWRRDSLLARLAHRTAAWQPGEALALATKIGDPESRAAAIEGIVRTWKTWDARAVGELLSGVPVGEDRARLCLLLAGLHGSVGAKEGTNH
jgi:hypothetical protein